MDQNGRPVAACVPTGVTAPLVTPTDRAFGKQSKIGAGSQIEGSYRPKGGLPS
jgi:hypothetical protein